MASPSDSVRRLVKHSLKDADTDQRVYLTSALPGEEHRTAAWKPLLGEIHFPQSGISHTPALPCTVGTCVQDPREAHGSVF